MCTPPSLIEFHMAHGSQFIHQVEYQGLQGSHHVIAVSEYTKQLLVSQYAVDPKKITVVHNGIDPLQKVLNQLNLLGQKVIVFMGRLTMQKAGNFSYNWPTRYYKNSLTPYLWLLVMATCTKNYCSKPPMINYPPMYSLVASCAIASETSCLIEPMFCYALPFRTIWFGLPSKRPSENASCCQQAIRSRWSLTLSNSGRFFGTWTKWPTKLFDWSRHPRRFSLGWRVKCRIYPIWLGLILPTKFEQFIKIISKPLR